MPEFNPFKNKKRTKDDFEKAKNFFTIKITSSPDVGDEESKKQLEKDKQQVAQQVASQKPSLLSGLENVFATFTSPKDQIEKGISQLQDNPIAGTVQVGMGVANAAFSATGIPAAFAVIGSVARKLGYKEAADNWDSLMNLPSTAVDAGTKGIEKGLEFVGFGKQRQSDFIKRVAVEGVATGLPEARILLPLITPKGQGEVASALDELNKTFATIGAFAKLGDLMPEKVAEVKVREVPKEINPELEKFNDTQNTLNNLYKERDARIKQAEQASGVNKQFFNVLVDRLNKMIDPLEQQVKTIGIEQNQPVKGLTQEKLPMELLKEQLKPEDQPKSWIDLATPYEKPFSNEPFLRSRGIEPQEKPLIPKAEEQTSDLPTLSEVQDASKKQSTEPISELGVRARLGEETRVRQPDQEIATARQGEGQEEKVVSTAVETPEGIVTGDKPFDAHNQIAEQKGVPAPEENRGFIVEDSQGNQSFVGREEGAKIAEQAGQITEPVKELHSEDLRKGQLPETPPSTETTLNIGAGFGLDKFYKNDIKPMLDNVTTRGKAIFELLKSIPKAFENTLQPAYVLERKFGKDPMADITKAFQEPSIAAESFRTKQLDTYDKNFMEMEQYFGRQSADDLRNFNLTRGEAVTKEGKAIQNKAKIDLSAKLKDPNLIKAIKEASDWAYNYLKQLKPDVEYFRDYFYGMFKDGENTTVEQAFERWKTHEKFTKEKSIPTPADAVGLGLELKEQNPITNIAKEVQAIGRRKGLEDLKTYLEKEKSPLMVDKDTATPEQLNKMKPIDDPVFKGKLFEPEFVDVVNSLRSVNQVMQPGVLRALRQVSQLAQGIKFFGSIFHFKTILKHSVAMYDGSMVNLKGLYKTFRTVMDLPYKEDVEYNKWRERGFDPRYGLETQTTQSLFKKTGTHWDKLQEKFWEGNPAGVIVQVPFVLLEQKWIPGSPGFVKWQFEEFIPRAKYQAIKIEAAKRSGALSRALTKGEELEVVRTIDQRFGEMNEKLYGRSATATSALRIVFMAPGYGEGNFRTTLNAAKVTEQFAKGSKARSDARYIANSLLATATMASVGTLMFTGKMPKAPTNADELRDLFKIDTGQKDGNGDKVYIDMMDFDKDYWSVYGNIATGQVGKIPGEIAKRVGGAVSPSFNTFVDFVQMIRGQDVRDYKGDKIFNSSDSLDEKIKKFWEYQASGWNPISKSVTEQGLQKGTSTLTSLAIGLGGFRPTTSERTKELKQIRTDLYDMRDERQKKILELDRLVRENKDEAIKQAKEFNKEQIDKLIKAAKKLGFQPGEEIPQKDVDAYIIKTLNEREPQTTEESTIRVLMPSTTRRRKKK